MPDTDSMSHGRLCTPQPTAHPGLHARIDALLRAAAQTREDLEAVFEILRLLLQVARFPAERLCLCLRPHQGVFVSVCRFQAPGG